MREIKFRAHCKPDNRFYYLTIGQGAAVFNDRDIYNQLCLDGVSFEQFTGLHDKNGKDIYECDICRIKFDIAKVEDYIYNSLTKKELESGERIFIVESPLFNNQQELNVDDIEVIGNIHEKQS